MVDSMDELMHRVRGRLYRMQELSERLAAIRIRESAADGAVVVEMDGNGALVNLVLSDSIALMAANDFETAVVAAAAAATDRALAQQAALVRDFNSEIAG
ncbi:YbaB/EbfC family nucleoid-associated protein [Nocardia sp. NPDC058658]|uniref:YbaB/EbfC family nucleoid-associated protein n=1 Tax=Nocardia sp. NPDC058658 TaxID=3346580 RepID=UPI003654021A